MLGMDALRCRTAYTSWCHSSEALSMQFTKELLGWFLQVSTLKFLLYSLGRGKAPLLDIIVYVGCTFMGISLAILAGNFSRYPYYIVLTGCMGFFLVKTMKRVLFKEVRIYERHSSITMFSVFHGCSTVSIVFLASLCWVVILNLTVFARCQMWRSLDMRTEMGSVG